MLHLSDAGRADLCDVRGQTGPFLAELLASVDWSGYDIVGFASSCNQNVASLSLARMLKRAHPSLTVVFGGANWAGPLGVAMLTRFPFVDVAFLGDADRSLPMLVDAVGAGRDPSECSIPGIAFRQNGAIHVTDDAPVFDLDALPSPDFTDYFTCLDRHEGVRDRREVSLWLQMSRGCWWGEKQPCRFCGLNGPRREYRTKSSRRILEELRRTAALWPGLPINLADTVVAPALLDEVLRGLADDPLGVPLWFEVRPTLTRSQVRAIAAAKASIQVGIESLSDRTLGLMHKGSTVLGALRLLKWCEADGVPVGWSIIYDIPGETDEDLLEMIRLLPLLRSLPAPAWVGPMSLDRFSSFHDDPERYAISDVRVSPAYACVYPWGRLAGGDRLHVRVPRERGLVRSACIRRLERESKAWRDDRRRSAIRSAVGEGGVPIVDRVNGETRAVVLDDVGLLVCSACDDVATRLELLDLVRGRSGTDGVEAEALLDRHLSRLVDEGILVAVGDSYLSLARPSGRHLTAGRRRAR